MKHENISPTVEVLLAGRERIRQGWCKDALTDKHGRFCALGAVIVDVRPYGGTDAAHALYTALRELGPMMVSDYNNAPTTTQADILALFDRAIAIELG